MLKSLEETLVFSQWGAMEYSRNIPGLFSVWLAVRQLMFRLRIDIITYKVLNPLLHTQRFIEF